MPDILTATDLLVRYNENVVLENATLGIEEDDRIGLVGRNGCGKTTFLRILAGLQAPDRGEVTRRRDLVVSYLPQDFLLDPGKTVAGNVRDGAQHVLDLIAEFESLPAEVEAPRRTGASHRGARRLDARSTHRHHHVPPELSRPATAHRHAIRRRERAGWRWRARSCPGRNCSSWTNRPTIWTRNPSNGWRSFWRTSRGSFLVVTHDRYFLDRVVDRHRRVGDGRFFRHDGNYTDYLLDKAERQAADAVVEHKRQMFLKKELAWVRQGPRAQRSKQKDRFERYYETAAQDGSGVEEDMELVHPAAAAAGQSRRGVDPPRAWNSADAPLFSGFSFTLRERPARRHMRPQRPGQNHPVARSSSASLRRRRARSKTGQLTRFNYVDQSRLQLNEERTVLDEAADGTEFVHWGESKISLRSYLKRFLFADERITTQVKQLSGGERSRLLLARILKCGGNFLMLDEPTNDLDLPTLRVLEEALIAFPGVVRVVSHDRYFLNRVCTDILAFEGDGRIHHSVGDYDYYLEKRQRLAAAAIVRRAATPPPREKPVTRPRDASPKPRKLTFKESRELEGMEAQILGQEKNIARIETLFASPDLHRTHGPQTHELVAELAASKETLTKLYARWEET